MMRKIVLACVLFTAAIAAGGDKKPQGAQLVKLADKTVELKVFWLPTPVQKCTNWAWAVAVEAMLKAQQVTLKQNYWVSKANLGEVCVDDAPTMEGLAKVVNGEYVLDDGRHVRLKSAYVSGAPTIPDDLIAPLRDGRPVLLFWKSRPLVVRAATYDEYIYPNGQRMFQIKEMKLVDPLRTGKQREVSFVNGRDDPGEIDGVFQVVVIPEKKQTW